MRRAGLAALLASAAVSVYLACALIDARAERDAAIADARYSARLAVTLCRTDTECERAESDAIDVGVTGRLYLTGLATDGRD